MSELDDVAQALVPEGSEPFTFKLPSGEEKTVQVRAITWTEIADCAAKAATYSVVEGKTQMGFNSATYRVEVLKLRILTKPWNSDSVLRKLKPEVGAQIDVLVPSPFGAAAEAEPVPQS